jgi:predicted transcriptional regulator
MFIGALSPFDTQLLYRVRKSAVAAVVVAAVAAGGGGVDDVPF